MGDREKCLEYLKMAIENIEIVEKKKIEILSKFIEKNFKSFVYVKDKKKEMKLYYCLSEIVLQIVKLRVFMQEQMTSNIELENNEDLNISINDFEVVKS